MRSLYPVLVAAAVTLAGAGVLPAVTVAADDDVLDGCTTISEPGVYRLGSDVTNGSAAACVEIAADDVVLDGANHTVTGNGSGVAVDVRADDERAQDPYENVTVRDVRVESWETGVSFVNVRNATVSGVTVEDADTGVQVGDGEYRRPGYPVAADGTVVRNATLRGVDRGVEVELSDRVTVTGNDVSTDGHAGVRLDVVSDSAVVRNDVTAAESSDAVVLAATDDEFGAGTHDNVVAENRIRNGDVRVSLDADDVTGNRVVDNGLTDGDVTVGGSREPTDTLVARNSLTDGVVAVDFASDVRVLGNDLTDTDDATDRPAGVRVRDAGHVLVRNNAITGARVGISLSNLATDNGVTGNRVTDSDVGVRIARSSVNNTVERNVLADDGVGVQVDLPSPYESGVNTLRGNDVTNATDGVEVLATGAPLVVRSTDFADTERGVHVHAPAGCVSGAAGAELVAVHGNEFGENATYGVLNEDGDVLNATGNDWGAGDGPSSPDDTDAPLADPVTGTLADGNGSAVSEDPDAAGVSNVHFDADAPTAGGDGNETAA